MVIRDHIKLTSGSPLRGANIEEFGERFFDMTQVYTPVLRQIAKKCGEASPIRFHEGVYMFFAGPQFETPAEIRAARILGADAIGMSTVAEAITAAHCGMPLLALSVMTNMAAGVIPDTPVTGEEVDAVGEMVSNALTAYVKELIVRIGEEYINDATD